MRQATTRELVERIQELEVANEHLKQQLAGNGKTLECVFALERCRELETTVDRLQNIIRGVK